MAQEREHQRQTAPIALTEERAGARGIFGWPLLLLFAVLLAAIAFAFLSR